MGYPGLSTIVLLPLIIPLVVSVYYGNKSPFIKGKLFFTWLLLTIVVSILCSLGSGFIAVYVCSVNLHKTCQFDFSTYLPIMVAIIIALTIVSMPLLYYGKSLQQKQKKLHKSP